MTQDTRMNKMLLLKLRSSYSRARDKYIIIISEIVEIEDENDKH